jgi:hypothetical protein
LGGRDEAVALHAGADAGADREVPLEDAASFGQVLDIYWARGAIVVWLGLVALFDGLRALLLVRRFPLVSLGVVAIAASVACAAVFLYTSEHIEAFLLSREGTPTRRSRPAT